MKFKTLVLLAAGLLAPLNAEIVASTKNQDLDTSQLHAQKHQDCISDCQPQFYSVGKILGQPFQGDIKIAFHAEGVTVDGCNLHNADVTYDETGDNFMLGRFASTRRFCPDDRDSEVMDYLKYARSYQIQQNKMQIKAQNGETIFTLYRGGEPIHQQGQQVKMEQLAPIPDIPFPKNYKFIPEHQDLNDTSQCRPTRIRHQIDARNIKFQLVGETEESDDAYYVCVTLSETAMMTQAHTYQWVNFNLIRLKDSEGEVLGILQPVSTHYYNLSHNYRQFDNKFIANKNDPVVRRIKEFAEAEYPHYLDPQKINAAFKFYLVRDIQYQVLFLGKQIDRNFMLIMNYNPEGGQLTLKSLTLLDFGPDDIYNVNCSEVYKSVCYSCKEGFSFYKGRCYKTQKQCLEYDLEQCLKCQEGYQLLRGRCVRQ